MICKPICTFNLESLGFEYTPVLYSYRYFLTRQSFSKIIRALLTAICETGVNALNPDWGSHNLSCSKSRYSSDYFRQYTLSDKISTDKIFGGQNFSAGKTFGTKSKFRQFCPTKFFHRFLIFPYNSQEKYVLT